MTKLKYKIGDFVYAAERNMFGIITIGEIIALDEGSYYPYGVEGGYCLFSDDEQIQWWSEQGIIRRIDDMLCELDCI
jgi:hypothetical protein